MFRLTKTRSLFAGLTLVIACSLVPIPAVAAATPAPTVTATAPTKGWVVRYNRFEDELEVYHPTLDAARPGAPTVNVVILDGNKYLYLQNDRYSQVLPYTRGPVAEYRGRYYRSWWTRGEGSLNLPRGRTLLVGVAVDGRLPTRSEMTPVVIDGVKYFSQEAAPWATRRYGTHRYATTYAEAGCGPASAAMVLSTLGGRGYSVESMGANAIAWGDRWANNGTEWTFFDHIGARIRRNTPTTSFSQAKEALGRGALVVAVMGPGYFTAEGHYVVLTGLNGSDQIWVADPNMDNRILYNGTGPRFWNTRKDGIYTAPAFAVRSDAKKYWIFEQ